jgi:hypothetical protein
VIELLELLESYNTIYTQSTHNTVVILCIISLGWLLIFSIYNTYLAPKQLVEGFESDKMMDLVIDNVVRSKKNVADIKDIKDSLTKIEEKVNAAELEANKAQAKMEGQGLLGQTTNASESIPNFEAEAEAQKETETQTQTETENEAVVNGENGENGENGDNSIELEGFALL